jgi:acetyl-CoA C-acetyltransferase
MIKLDEECMKFHPDKFAGLRPAFAKNGTITAANASKINDGACAFVLMSEEAAKSRGLKPIARILGFEDAGV